MLSVLRNGPYRRLWKSARTQAEFIGAGLGHMVGSRAREEGGKKMDTESDPAL